MAAHPEPGSDEAVLEAPLAGSVVRMLELLAELPSTPPPVADQAASLASSLVGGIPTLSAPGQPVNPTVVPRVELVSIAGLLDLLAGMPSTPPAVAEDARDRADDLWHRVPADPDDQD